MVRNNKNQKRRDTLQIFNPFTRRSLTQPNRNEGEWVRQIRRSHIVWKFFVELELFKKM